MFRMVKLLVDGFVGILKPVSRAEVIFVSPNAQNGHVDSRKCCRERF